MSSRGQIRLNGEVVPLAQKGLAVLVYLIGWAGQVVAKEEMIEALWPQALVEEANLTQSIYLVCKAFSDDAFGSRYMITVPGHAYQLGAASGAPQTVQRLSRFHIP